MSLRQLYEPVGLARSPVRKTRFTEVKMVAILREADETPVAEVAAAGSGAASSCSHRCHHRFVRERGERWQFRHHLNFAPQEGREAE